ncbi:MAG: hypothetical protein AAF701_07095, partial [Pseudomonadota bacterium]
MHDPRANIREHLMQFWADPAAHSALWAKNATLHAAWPVDHLTGRDAIIKQFVTPIRTALK